MQTKQNKRTELIVKIVFRLLIISLFIALCVHFLNVSDKKYWESQGESWKRDCEFFGIESIDDFDPRFLVPKDPELTEASWELLHCIINNEPFENGSIVIDKENLDHLQTELIYIDAFYVVQIDNKAAVTFRFSAKPAETEKAIKSCIEYYKRYPYDKIYLEKIDGKWVVADVFRQA